MIRTAFEIGNSVALTIPKKLGIKPGTKVKFRRESNKLVYELLEPKLAVSQENTIRKTSAAFKIKVPNLNQVLTRLKENQYDKQIRIS